MRQPVPFGKYLLLDRISVGGMAEVFKAKSYGVEGFEKIIAIKRILPTMGEDREFIKMFIDEAKIAGQLAHSNICQIFELGRIDGSHFIAMEFIWGKDLLQLQNRLRKIKKPMSAAMACFVIAKVCEGLDYAHRKRDQVGRPMDIVHRDCSPQNVLISYDGETKIIDFGIAKASSRSSRTQAGVLKGKFGYMSPEQVRGLPLDRRSDIFALGTILYECLTSSRLFQGETDFATLEKVRNVAMPSPRSVNPEIPVAVEKIVLKALTKDVDERYAWCSDMLADLQAYLMSQSEVFTAKTLGAALKELFATEVDREKQQLEQYKKMGRDGLIAGVPAAQAKVDVVEQLGEAGEASDPTMLGGPSFEELEELGTAAFEGRPASKSEANGRPAKRTEDDFVEEVPTEIFNDDGATNLQQNDVPAPLQPAGPLAASVRPQQVSPAPQLARPAIPAVAPKAVTSNQLAVPANPFAAQPAPLVPPVRASNPPSAQGNATLMMEQKPVIAPRPATQTPAPPLTQPSQQFGQQVAPPPLSSPYGTPNNAAAMGSLGPAANQATLMMDGGVPLGAPRAATGDLGHRSADPNQVYPFTGQQQAVAQRAVTGDAQNGSTRTLLGMSQSAIQHSMATSQANHYPYPNQYQYGGAPAVEQGLSTTGQHANPFATQPQGPHGPHGPHGSHGSQSAAVQPGQQAAPKKRTMIVVAALAAVAIVTFVVIKFVVLGGGESSTTAGSAGSANGSAVGIASIKLEAIACQNEPCRVIVDGKQVATAKSEKEIPVTSGTRKVRLESNTGELLCEQTIELAASSVSPFVCAKAATVPPKAGSGSGSATQSSATAAGSGSREPVTPGAGSNATVGSNSGSGAPIATNPKVPPDDSTDGKGSNDGSATTNDMSPKPDDKSKPPKVVKPKITEPVATSNPGVGYLAVLSEPAGAKVSVDGASTGKVTPVSKIELPIGKHKVTLETDTVKTTFTVVIKAGVTETLSKELK